MMMMCMSTHGKHPKQIDCQSHPTNDQKLGGIIHLWRIDDPLDRFEDDKDADEDQEDAVRETGEGLYSAVADGDDEGGEGRGQRRGAHGFEVSAYTARSFSATPESSAHPNVNVESVFHVAMTLANRPIPIAAQSKNI